MSQSILDVLSHHMTCVARSDVDGIMQDYTEQSVLFSPDGVLTGTNHIRQFFTNLTGSMMPAGTNFVAVRQDVRGDTAFLIWQADAPTLKFHMGAETLTIRDGKIVIHSFAAAIERKID
jgi:ketosteroid isomerase-like protein